MHFFLCRIATVLKLFFYAQKGENKHHFNFKRGDPRATRYQSLYPFA